MFMVRPMPLAILIHEVIYEEYAEKERRGKKYKDPVILKNVLVQPASNIKSSNIADQVAYNSLLFFDCVNSKPSDVEFKKQSKITFNGEEMIVNKINPIYTFSLHHYELELI